MKQINGVFKSRYYLTQKGQIYDRQNNHYLKKYSHNSYRLKTVNGQYKSISLKELYRNVYNKQFCIDDIENLQNEEWKEIKDTKGFYYVSTCGRVKSYHGYKSVLLRTNRNKGGYDRVDIRIDGIRQTKLVSHLVAYTFLPMPDKPFMQLHHIDLDKNNNRVSNLQWLSKADHKKIHQKIREEKDNVST